MQYSTFIFSLLTIGSLCAQIMPGDSLAHLEILHEEHFPRPPFLIYFENAVPEHSTTASSTLLSLSEKTPVFYVAVNSGSEEHSNSFESKYPVIIYDSYGVFAQEVGIEILPTSIMIGENYVVKKVITGELDSHYIDTSSTPS